MKYCTANANSTGSSADLSASGSASSGASGLLPASGPVPDQNGIFFHGALQSQLPFGNGFLCTSGGIVRGAVVMSADRYRELAAWERFEFDALVPATEFLLPGRPRPGCHCIGSWM